MPYGGKDRIRHAAPLLRILTGDRRLGDLDDREWNGVLALARSAKLLPRLAVMAERDQARPALPEKVRDHLAWARTSFRNRVRATDWELNRIADALTHVDAPVILLKGAAYHAAGLPVSQGRVATDVDIMVPRRDLDDVEQALLAAGWVYDEHDDYDDRFYREWMHELPPLYHPIRRSVLDVHHTILPVISRMKPDADSLVADAVAVPNSRFLTLSAQDMVLHSAVHLFQDGEVKGDLRDLVDIRDLVQDFERASDFWPKLTARAEELGLGRPLFYALHYAEQLLRLELPAAVQAEMARWRPVAPVLAIMESCVPDALIPCGRTRPDFRHRLSVLLLYIRSHWLRMPAWLLAFHLIRKAFKRKQEESW